MIRLPTGRAGQVLAVLLVLVAVAATWSAVAAPLLAWHAERADGLLRRETLARRMTELARSVPALDRASALAHKAGPAPIVVLQGPSDAVAGAALQQALQGMAGQIGLSFTSLEALPAEQLGAYRRIAVRVAVTAPWTQLTALLDSVLGASPQMLVDDLQLHGQRGFIRDPAAPIDASLVVMGFRSGTDGG